MYTFESTSDGASQETAERTREDSRGDVDGEALRLLRLFVPGRDYKQNPGSESSLENTNEDSENHQMVEVVDGCHTTGQSAPDRHDHGQIYRWFPTDQYLFTSDGVQQHSSFDREILTMLLGGSKTTYVTKKTTKAIEYWLLDMFKSSVIPAILAFPMFVLSFSTSQLVSVKLGITEHTMYDSRYINQIVGIRKRSILWTNFFSSSGVQVTRAEPSEEASTSS